MWSKIRAVFMHVCTCMVIYLSMTNKTIQLYGRAPARNLLWDTVWGGLAAKSRNFSEHSSLVFNEIWNRIIWLYRWQHQQFIIGRSANTSWSENWNLVSFHEQFIIGWICAQTVPKRMTQWPLRRSPASDNPYLKTIIFSICHEY